MDPVEARKWVAEKMIPTFPLNAFRDRTPGPLGNNVPPQRPVVEVLEIDSKGDRVEPEVGAKGACSAAGAFDGSDLAKHARHFRTLTIEVAGFGGQGVLLLGQLVAEMGMREGLEVSWLPSYGPEMRSGSAHCHVCLSKQPIGSPLISHPDVLIAMNEVSLRKFAPDVTPEGLILYNRDTLPAGLDLTPARVICIPASEIADKLGSTRAANIVLLGALLEETECLAPETALEVIEDKLRKAALLDVNRKALEAGRQFMDEKVWVGAETQPDGFAY